MEGRDPIQTQAPHPLSPLPDAPKVQAVTRGSSRELEWEDTTPRERGAKGDTLSLPRSALQRLVLQGALKTCSGGCGSCDLEWKWRAKGS